MTATARREVDRTGTRGYTIPMTRSLLAMLLLAPLAACTSPRAAVPSRDPDPLRARAALATVHVDNRTAERVTILYRHAIRTGAAVAIGDVAPSSRAELAPVPAGEPLVLVARTTAGAELTLPARSFDIDSHWTWLIPADARFGGGAP
jgi:hypothetical protein